MVRVRADDGAVAVRDGHVSMAAGPRHRGAGGGAFGRGRLQPGAAGHITMSAGRAREQSGRRRRRRKMPAAKGTRPGAPKNGKWKRKRPGHAGAAAEVMLLMSGAETRTRRGSEEEIVFMPPAAPKSPWVTIFLAFVVVVSLLPLGLYVYYGTVQRSLELAVEREGLSVRFGVGRIDIPWEDMAGVAYVEQPARMGRVAGAGLPGLQMGWYRLEGYGRVYRLTTAARPVVYVDTRPDAGSARPGTRYVFSPQDAEQFAALLQAMRAGAGAEGAPGAPSGPAAGAAPGALPIPAVFRSAPGPSVMVDPLMIISLLVTAPLVFIILYFARKGARGLRYAVGPQGVVVYHLGRKVYRW